MDSGAWHHLQCQVWNSRYRKYVFRRRGPFSSRLCMRRNEYSCNAFDKLILASIDILHRHPQNYLYTAHHNLLGICHQLKIRLLYGTFNFSSQCIIVWEPEACLSMVFVVFVERRALYEGKAYLR